MQLKTCSKSTIENDLHLLTRNYLLGVIHSIIEESFIEWVNYLVNISNILTKKEEIYRYRSRVAIIIIAFTH